VVIAYLKERSMGKLTVYLLLITVIIYAQAWGYSGGAGTPNDPYQIATAADLIRVGETPEDYDKHFILTSDIDLDPNLPGRKVFDRAVIAPDIHDLPDDWGDNVYDGAPFSGVFNGHGHAVSHLRINGSSFLGLFGRVGSEATIQNLGLDDVYINGTGDCIGGLVGECSGRIITSQISGIVYSGGGYSSVGGLVGRQNGGSIVTSGSSGMVKGRNDTGGLVGLTSQGHVFSSYSVGSVTGKHNVGGLVGRNREGAIIASYSKSPVSGQDNVGGLVGENDQASITACYSTGPIKGEGSVGGLVGENSRGSIAACYSIGKVSGENRVGGLVGNGWLSQGPASFWNTETSGQTFSVGGTGLTTAEMQDINTYLDAGWDFIDEILNGTREHWQMSGGDYPRLCHPRMLEGAGTAEAPYLIRDAWDLGAIWFKPTAYYRLEAPLDLAETTWSRAVIPWFGGIIDGNGQVITNLGIEGTDSLGLCGELHAGAEITNLGLEAVHIRGSGENIGALAGQNRGNVTECYSSGSIQGSGRSVGGLVGRNWNDIANSHSNCIVKGYQSVGGLAGWNAGSVTTSFSHGEVAGNNDDVGGLIGHNEGRITTTYSTAEAKGREGVGGLAGSNDGTIIAGSATGTVTGSNSVGGLVGSNHSSVIACYSMGSASGQEGVGGLVGKNTSERANYRTYYGNITASYSTGMVQGDEQVGGLVGHNEGGTIVASFWDRDTSGQVESAAGTGLASTKMQDVTTFLGAGWDFVDETLNGACDYWQMSAGDYPRLFYCPEHWPTMPLGLGIEQDPYLIRDIHDLGSIWFEPTAYYRLDTSLDLSGTMWNAAIVPWFGGSFDGNGLAISHLHIQGSEYLGLFGQSAAEASIANLGLDMVDVNGIGDNVGGLVGHNAGEISDCASAGAVTGRHGVGGLVGRSRGRVTRSYSSGTVIGTSRTGGLLGSNYSGGAVSECYSTAMVSAEGAVGGLTGLNYASARIGASYSTGTVSGDFDVGGLVGHNFANLWGDGSITACYSTGLVNATGEDVGGLVGSGWGDVDDCFWDMETSNQASSTGGTGKTTAEMIITETFVCWWSDPAWMIDEGENYPRLHWEGLPGEPMENPFWMGTGTENDPYLIHTADQFNAIGLVPCEWDKHFKLMADLDLSGYQSSELNIIRGAASFNASFGLSGRWFYSNPFSGVFDGNGHTISNFTYDSNGLDRIGLFGNVSHAVIKDLGLISPTVSAGTGDSVGALVGYLSGGTVTGCYVKGGQVTGGKSVGGLVGHNGGGNINVSYSTSTVTGDEGVGGLIGSNYGSVTGCFSTAPVSGKENIGGLVGTGNLFEVRTCVWDVQISGLSGSAGGVGLASQGMMDPYILGLNGFAEDPNWVMDNGHDHPHLAWEGTAGQTIPVPHIHWLEGRGTEADPYRVDTTEQLMSLAQASALWDRHFTLGADIDLHPDLVSTSILTQALIPSFAGVFDGNDHTVANLTIEGGGYLGLFGVLLPGAEVRNLGVLDVLIKGSGNHIGALAGSNRGWIEMSYSSGAVTGNRNVGGLTGYNYGSVNTCWSTGTVHGDQQIGGLVGGNTSDIVASYSTGTVSGNFDIGGLVGSNYSSITMSYSTGTVEGNKTRIGGLVGSNNEGDITGCYSNGMVIGNDDRVGGLVGSSSRGTVGASFWDIQTSGLDWSDSGQGKTTAELKTAGTFLNAGWDFVNETANGTEDIWWILNGQDYPALWWEPKPRCASFPYPQNHAVNIHQTLVLGWQVGAWTAYHDVYFGEDEDIVALATTEDVGVYQGRLPADVTTFTAAPLIYGTTYYWRIDEVNEAESDVPCPGPVWQFTTAEFIAGPNPTDQSTPLGWPTTLSWTPSGTALWFDIYLGEDERAVAQATPESNGLYRGRQAGDESSFNTGNLQPNTTYFWRIDGVDSALPENLWKGGVWQFRTQDAMSGHTPADQTIGVGWPVSLSWEPGGPGLDYDVYFGTDWYDVADASTDSLSVYHGRQTGKETSFNTGNLQPSQTYFWRIDTVDGVHPEKVWKGQVWQFTTRDLIVSYAPENRTTGVGWPVNLSWEPGGLGFNYDVYFGDDEGSVAVATPDSIGIYRGQQTTEEISFDTGNLNPNTSYFWRIDGVDGAQPQNPWKGKVYRFTTANATTRHYPGSNATYIPRTVTLTWEPGGPGLHYDLFFGTNEDAVADATRNTVGIYQGQQAPRQTSFNPGNLESGTTYFWRIDAINSDVPQDVWKGKLWKFTTVTGR